MQHHTSKFNTNPCSNPTAKLTSLRARSEEILNAIATLGLVAAIVDGEADTREIESFMLEFKKHFALSRLQALKHIGFALRRIRAAKETNIIDSVCDTLNEHLDSSQKLRLFHDLTEVLIADGKVHEGEEHFLDYVALKLHLEETLKNQYQIF